MKSVVITRPRSQAEAFASNLSEAGYIPIFFPVIEIHPIEDTSSLDRAIQKLDCYDWVVFTSVNGVEVFWARLRTLGMEGLPQELLAAAIGPKTAEAMRFRGINPDFIPKEYIAEKILPGLGDLNGRWVLLPRAGIARKALPQAILEAGGVAHEIAVYHTLPAQPDPQSLEVLRSGVDIVTFTSPSTVHHFVTIVRNSGLDPFDLPGHPLVACIGPITASAAREEGLAVDIVAGEYTNEGLVKALCS